MTAKEVAAGRPVEERPTDQDKRCDFDYSTSGQCPSTPGASSGTVSAARWFLEQMFDEATSHTRLMFIWDNTTEKRWLFDTPSTAASYAMAAGANSDVYVSSALRQSGSRNGGAGRSNVTAITCLRLEVDVKNSMAASKGGSAERLGDAVQFLNGCPLAPSIITNSGNGVQAYWLFDKMWSVRDVTPRAAAREFFHRWDATTQRYAQQRGWQVNSVWDLAGPIRIPGTFSKNIDSKEQVRIIWPVKADTPARYGRDDIQREFSECTVPSLQVSPPGLSAAACARLSLARRSDVFIRLWNGELTRNRSGLYASPC